MSSPSPEAHFDLLFVLHELEKGSLSLTRHEIALFCYLSCLLSVYRGHPPSEWGYRFSATRTYAPYSDDLAVAIDRSVGVLIQDDARGGFSLSTAGRAEVQALRGLRRFLKREVYLQAACASTLALPLPRVSESVGEEPQLRRALDLSSTRPLLDEAGREAILKHFEALSEVFPADSDLFTPAVVWLTYLSRQVDKRLEGTA